MRPREKYERKHIHIWVISRNQPPMLPFGSWYKGSPRELTRECTGCGTSQHATVPLDEESKLPPDALLAIADLDWSDK